MEYGMKIEQTYLGFPIQAEQPEETLEIFSGNTKIYEFRIPVCKNPEKVKYDYYSYLSVEQYKDCELTLKGNFDEHFFEQICQTDKNLQEPIKKPLIHFAADRGWINDPNGLVYHNGTYHLYFQYNPMNTQWQNMSWGHAVSRDLLHFEQQDSVMYPDENGAMFSGCGLVNEKGLLGLPENALLFYYSAAGDTTKWSEGKQFTQRIAYSLDDGKTLLKLPKEAVGVIEKDSRDPKIFWHEASGAYIMVLWIKGYEFGFLRSTDLMNWIMTSTIELEKAWECPDLFCLECEGETYWIFTSADGFYYIGQFDGYTFKTDKVRHNAYLTSLPYAAQTYSNTKGRTISVPWLRTKNEGRLYTGMLGLPREAGLVKNEDKLALTLLPVSEYEAAKEQIVEFSWGEAESSIQIAKETAVELALWPENSKELTVGFFGEKMTLCDNVLCYKKEKTVFPETIKEIHIIVDRGVVEVYANGGTMNAYYENDIEELQGTISIKGCCGAGKIYQICGKERVQR